MTGSVSESEQTLTFELERILRRENLIKDPYFKKFPFFGGGSSQLPVDSLLSYPTLRTLNLSAANLLQASAKSSRLTVDFDQKTVTPDFEARRTTVILRELPHDVHVSELLRLFSSCPALSIPARDLLPPAQSNPNKDEDLHTPTSTTSRVSAWGDSDVDTTDTPSSSFAVKPGRIFEIAQDGDCWFVSVDREEAAEEFAQWLQRQSFRGDPLKVRMKSTTSRSRPGWVPGYQATFASCDALTLGGRNHGAPLRGELYGKMQNIIIDQMADAPHNSRSYEDVRCKRSPTHKNPYGPSSTTSTEKTSATATVTNSPPSEVRRVAQDGPDTVNSRVGTACGKAMATAAVQTESHSDDCPPVAGGTSATVTVLSTGGHSYTEADHMFAAPGTIPASDGAVSPPVSLSQSPTGRHLDRQRSVSHTAGCSPPIGVLRNSDAYRRPDFHSKSLSCANPQEFVFYSPEDPSVQPHTDSEIFAGGSPTAPFVTDPPIHFNQKASQYPTGHSDYFDKSCTLETDSSPHNDRCFSPRATFYNDRAYRRMYDQAGRPIDDDSEERCPQIEQPENAVPIATESGVEYGKHISYRNKGFAGYRGIPYTQPTSYQSSPHSCTYYPLPHDGSPNHEVYPDHENCVQGCHNSGTPVHGTYYYFYPEYTHHHHNDAHHHSPYHRNHHRSSLSGHQYYQPHHRSYRGTDGNRVPHDQKHFPRRDNGHSGSPAVSGGHYRTFLNSRRRLRPRGGSMLNDRRHEASSPTRGYVSEGGRSPKTTRGATKLGSPQVSLRPHDKREFPSLDEAITTRRQKMRVDSSSSLPTTRASPQSQPPPQSPHRALSGRSRPMTLKDVILTGSESIRSSKKPKDRSRQPVQSDSRTPAMEDDQIAPHSD